MSASSPWELRPIAALAEVATHWDAFNARLGDVPFLKSQFLIPLLDEFGSGAELVACCGGVEDPLAMAIVSRRGFGRWETFQPSQLPLGAWLGRPDAEFDSLVAGLARSLPGFVFAVGVTQLDPLFAPRPADGRRVRTLDYVGTAWVDVRGGFEEYWAARGKNLRQNMRRQRAKLETEGVAATLETLRSPGDVPQAIADYGALESAGWKAEGGTAISPSNAQGRFYGAMLESFCRSGAGRIYRYRFGEKVVAMDLCIEGAGTLVVLKTAYDESEKTLSPASLMREEAFAAIFREGKVKRVEFYGRLMEWHTRWTANARTLYHANFYRWPMLSAAKDRIDRLRAAQRQSVPTHS